MTKARLSHTTNTDISFRRNDADRRQSRPMIRPNDGPGDWSVRARLAAEARERADRKRINLDRPKTATELAHEQREADRLSILRFVALNPFGVDQRNMADHLGLAYSKVAKLVLEMVATGLVETTASGQPGRGQSVKVTATDSGVDAAEAQPQ